MNMYVDHYEYVCAYEYVYIDDQIDVNCLEV